MALERPIGMHRKLYGMLLSSIYPSHMSISFESMHAEEESPFSFAQFVADRTSLPSNLAQEVYALGKHALEDRTSLPITSHNALYYPLATFLLDIARKREESGQPLFVALSAPMGFSPFKLFSPSLLLKR